MGTLVAKAAGASRSVVARRAFRGAFIGDPFVFLRNEEAGALPAAQLTRGTLRKDNIDLQMAKRVDQVTEHCVTQSAAKPTGGRLTPCASRGSRSRTARS